MDHMDMHISRGSCLRKRFWSLATMGFIIISLSGCGSWTDIKRAMGIEKTPISDTEIVQLPPLVIPPDYQIRPPSDGSPSDPYPAMASSLESEISQVETPPGAPVVVDAAGVVVEQVSSFPVDSPVPVPPSAVPAPAPNAPPVYSPLYFPQTDPTLAVFNRAFWDYGVANFSFGNRPVYVPGAVR